MHIVVDRFVSDADTTISRVMVDGDFACFGLEDEYREEKVPKETRIPAGTYPIRLLKKGSHHERYSNRFPDIHRGMLHLQDVPNFTGILIHVGNTEKDTDGCLLVGSQAITEPSQMAVTQSVVAYRRLYTMVAEAAADGTLTIEFQDNDRPLATPVRRRKRAAKVARKPSPTALTNQALQARAQKLARDFRMAELNGKTGTFFSDDARQVGQVLPRSAYLELAQLSADIEGKRADPTKIERFLAIASLGLPT